MINDDLRLDQEAEDDHPPARPSPAPTYECVDTGLRRLATRFHRQAASVLAVLHLACALICVRFSSSSGA
jgi:hypothetical protein